MEENKIGNISSISTDNNLMIKSDGTPFGESFYFNEYYDEKALKKFIKGIEKMVRTSKEYNLYIENLRTNISVLNQDNILANITTNDANLELHHYPFTLYDIIETMIFHKIATDEKFNSFNIAKEVMMNHNKQIIGLVSLSHTNHELAHDGVLFISKDQVFGDYHRFMNKYSKGVSASMKEKINNMESADNVLSDINGIYN